MTAEVAIANANGVALAADSAVTIGGQKIYNSALKLFSLSKTEPVGIMIYGNSGLINTPWETLIKTCREELGDKSEKTLEQYGDAFIKFINSNKNLFSESDQRNFFESYFHHYLLYIREEFLLALKKLDYDSQKVDGSELKKIIKDIIFLKHKSLSSKKLLVGMSKKFEESVKSKYRKEAKKVIKNIFENTPLSNILMSKLYDIGVWIFTRDIFIGGSSGVVIAGYGKDEIYPSILTYEIGGFLNGKLKYRVVPEKTRKYGVDADCGIHAFAQEDMVNSFMLGINPDINQFLVGSIRQLLNELPEFLNNSIKDKQVIDKFRSDCYSIYENFISEFTKQVQTSQVDPVLNMVKVLPKDELAAMAEALVNLTAFKRKMTDSVETVGGPIDVAVISKGDGLVWVKRKHYFPAELNQHFFRNYFRGMSHEPSK